MTNVQQRRQLNLTRLLPVQNAYTIALDSEYSKWAFNEERAPMNKGLWRSKVFQISDDAFVDLEIGTGNGTFFAHQALTFPDRHLIGLELKYKPLIQSIRRALNQGCKNAAICRYHAFNIDLLFGNAELDNVYIHFPDPWVSPRKPKNRTVNAEFLKILHGIQKPGSKIFFKTDSKEYFDWSLEEIQESPYKLIYKTYDLHKSEKQKDNFVTAFEKIFLKQGILINYLELEATCS